MKAEKPSPFLSLLVVGPSEIVGKSLIDSLGFFIVGVSLLLDAPFLVVDFVGSLCWFWLFVADMVSPSDLVIDFSHPLYLHPSNTLAALLVSHQLLEVENYNVWSRSMKIALLVKNKLGFMDDTCSKESLLNELGYQWE